MNIGKAHQRVIREIKAQEPSNDLFGYPTNPDIRQAELMKIDYQTAKVIIEEYEWLGTMGTTKYHYGIYFEGVLAGVVCFGHFQAPVGYSNYVGEKYANQGIQLSRGACVHWSHPHSASKLIGYGLRKMSEEGYKYVIAFSDEDAGEIGTVYQATNWFYLGKRANSSADYKIVFKKTGKVFCDTRDLVRKLGFRGLEKARKYVDSHKHLEIVMIKPKARYIRLIGNRRENKQMMEHLKDKILPYPKRTTAEDI